MFKNLKSQKFGENSENLEKIRKPNTFPKNKSIISYLRSKPSNLSRNVSKIAEI